MKTYIVQTYTRASIYETFEVKAENEEQAKKLAIDAKLQLQEPIESFVYEDEAEKDLPEASILYELEEQEK